jgi:O-antigen/teichoic acid export membrane protein
MYEELKRLLKHTAIYGTGSIIGKIVGFCMIPMYTRYLTPRDYGTVELLDLSVTLLGSILILWMNAAIIRQYYDYDDPKNKNEVISTMIILAVCMGITVVVTAAFNAKTLSQLILNSPNYYVYIYLIAGTFFMSCVNTVSWNYLRAKQKSSFAVKLELVQLSTAVCLNIYFVVIRQIGVIGILYSNLIANSLIAAIATTTTLSEVKLRFSMQKLKLVISFGYPLVFPALAAFAVNFSDRFFLQHFGTVSAVGIYSLGYKFGYMLSFLLIQPFDTIWGARLYEIAREHESGHMFARIFGYYCFALVMAALGLSLLIREVISVVAAPAFRDAYKVVPVVCLGYLFQALQRYFLTGMYLEKKTGTVGVIGLSSAILTLALNYVLIPRYGMMGAAWATAISFCGLASLMYVCSQRVHPIPYPVGRVVVLLVVASVYYAMSTVIVGLPVFPTVAIKLVLFAVFPGVLYIVRWFDSNEVQHFKRVLYLVAGRYRGLTATSESG